MDIFVLFRYFPLTDTAGRKSAATVPHGFGQIENEKGKGCEGYFWHGSHSLIYSFSTFTPFPLLLLFTFPTFLLFHFSTLTMKKEYDDLTQELSRMETRKRQERVREVSRLNRNHPGGGGGGGGGRGRDSRVIADQYERMFVDERYVSLLYMLVVLVV